MRKSQDGWRRSKAVIVTTEPSSISKIYTERSSRSKVAFENAKKWLPGGVARNSVLAPPYPIFIETGKGSYIWDVDGNELIDFQNNFTSLIHGHADLDVMEAARAQMENGTAFGAPTELEYELCDVVGRRMPSLEQMRFANSGSEAAQYCILAAKAYTGKKKIVKFQGAFHGLNEHLMVSMHPTYVDSAAEGPLGQLDSEGMNGSILQTTYALPYNQLGPLSKLLEAEAHSIAAIIVEPVLGVGGQIPATEEFLHGMRELATRYGIVLIFDEIVTGFRLAVGGAQEKFGIRADLTALGKIVGGGFSVGMFGGEREIMEVFDPSKGPRVPCSGTFAANPVTLTAGLTTLRKLNMESYEMLDGKAKRVEKWLDENSPRFGIPVNLTRAGSVFNLHFVNNEVTQYFDLREENKKMKNDFYISMFNQGISMAARGMCCISTPMTTQDINSFIDAMEVSLDAVRSAS
ncbi:MAG: aspartate aminotransferase family protein [Thaumarchaeota archaeon]|nr:aspartate aminotransferase family protein [Nitrososphaerota archaeon]